MESKILYRALKLSEKIYDESMYGVDDLYRIKDIIHSVDQNHWDSKKWLTDILYKHYGYQTGKFGDCDIDFRTMDVNDEVDLSEYTAIINTSCEHMEQEDLLSIIEKKQRQTWVAFQTNNYKDLNSHINCWPTAQLFAESLGLEYVAAVETLELKDFNRFMVIGK